MVQIKGFIHGSCGQYLHLYRANSAGGTYCKSIICAGIIVEIANNSIYIMTYVTACKTAKQSNSNLAEEPKL